MRLVKEQTDLQGQLADPDLFQQVGMRLKEIETELVTDYSRCKALESARGG